MDPLSDVLALLKPCCSLACGIDAGGDWSLQFPDQNTHIKCYAVVRGECWMLVDGVSEPMYLKQGDCFVLPSGRPFRLAADLSLPPEPSGKYLPAPSPGAVVTINGGGNFFLVGCRFRVSGGHSDILMGMLPPVVHIQSEAEQAALRWSVERMMQELNSPQAGSSLVTQHLAHMMLIQALRLHVGRDQPTGTGWLFGVVDKQLGPAIRAIHANPERRWTLQSLAQLACMSRSAFAQRFRDTVGLSPMEYVTRWRMLLAADKLENSSDSVSVISFSLGYESESAFSTAFKRVMGVSPRQYSRRMTASNDPAVFVGGAQGLQVSARAS
jgi:AraC-type DNA-binding domain-containing proteins